MNDNQKIYFFGVVFNAVMFCFFVVFFVASVIDGSIFGIVWNGLFIVWTAYWFGDSLEKL